MPSPIPVPTSPADVRLSLENLKATMRQAHPIDFQGMNRGLRKLLSIPMRDYLSQGPVLWDYAYALIDGLPELERQREMAEITQLLERVGFPKPQKRSTYSGPSFPPNLEQDQR